MRRCARTLLAVVALVFATAPAAWTQEQAQEPTPEPLEIGVAAPDFELPAASREGVLDEPVRLSDFAGQTVVLAFFFRARTRG